MTIYCKIPWNHLHITAYNKFGLCCYADDIKNSYHNFDEYWNSEEMKQIRLKMIKGDPPLICKKCFDSNKNTLISFKDRKEILWNNNIEKDLLRHTNESGFTTWYPRTIDIRTNFCNFKCRMCFEGCSSSIKNEKIKNNIKISKFDSNKTINDLNLSEERIKNLQFIAWSGGEPFMSPIHWELMDKLIELGNTKLTIEYTTNLSFPGNTLNKAIDLLSKFQNLYFQISLDGTGEDVEYIREGLNYQKFVENLKLIKKELQHAKLTIQYTATSIGLLTLPKLISTYHNMNFFNKLAFLYRKDHYLSINVIKPEIFECILQECIDAAKGTKLENDINVFVSFLKIKYTPKIYDKIYLDLTESTRGKVGYFEKRMAGLLNE